MFTTTLIIFNTSRMVKLITTIRFKGIKIIFCIIAMRFRLKKSSINQVLEKIIPKGI